VLTPMSVIGKPQGFTLLEVLGIIVLLGFACTLVYPNLVGSAEKTRMQYIGKLLTSDLQQVQEAAVTERDSVRVVLEDNGYYYTLGNNQITRVFPEHGFAFMTIIETTDGETAASLSEAAELIFQPDGSCNELFLNWQSQHFHGSLQVASDGTVSWNNATK
jgi:type II secretory pathway pseudopilin PulG